MVNCWNDDMANCCGMCDFKVVACIPVLGRLPLLGQTIRRLYQKNGVYKVICVGHQAEDRKVCERAGAEWVQYRNQPLGDKWNAAFLEAKKYKPDACLFVGSSDWISDNWLKEMRVPLEKYDLVGTAGCHFLHLVRNPLLVYWPGYVGIRANESIGIGRMISSRLLDKMQWKPFNPDLNSSLDGSMQQRCIKLAGQSHIVSNYNIKSVSISTELWENKHNFFDHYNGRLKSEIISEVAPWIESNFPEANQVFTWNNATSVRV